MVWALVHSGKCKENSDYAFQTMCIQPSAYHFKIGDHTILLTDRYKYLGLIFSEFLDYNVTAKVVARSAGRALGLLIAKTKAYGGMPYECFTKL